MQKHALIWLLIFAVFFTFLNCNRGNKSDPGKTELGGENPGSLIISNEQIGTISFYGHQSAKLFSREIEESIKGIIDNNLVSIGSGSFPKGFIKTSLPGHPWDSTSWTRDCGGFLRELALWGYLKPAVETAEYLQKHVTLNPEGFYTFPVYFKGTGTDSTGWGYELDGTAAVVIGMVRLWQRLPESNDAKEKLQQFLTSSESPVAFILKKLSSTPLIESSGEFGGGWGIDGKWFNIVTNNLLRQALLACAELEEECGNTDYAYTLRTKSTELMENISRYLIDPVDTSWIWCLNPRTMLTDESVLNFPLVRGTASINGASSCYADAEGLEPETAGWAGVRSASATLDKIYNNYAYRKNQFTRYGMCTFVDYSKKALIPCNASWLSYCDCFAAQTMLLLDKMESLDRIITWIAASTYMDGSPSADFIQKLARGRAKVNFNAPASTYWFSERNFTPDFEGVKDIGCGKLNLVNVAEPMKLARMMVGIDDRYSDTVRFVPRLPNSWTGFELRNWQVKTKTGVVQVDVDFVRREGREYIVHFTVKDGKSIPRLIVRFPDGTTKECNSVSGVLRLRSRMADISYKVKGNSSIPDSLASNLQKDKLPVLKFLGSATAELYAKEIEESFRGVLKYNYISTPTEGYPIGFVRASIPKNGWWETLWTRDGGTHLRELVHWGMLEHASALVDCLTMLVEKNEEGYYSFPEYFVKSKKAHGKELDGTSAIIIGMVDLWRALPKNHPSRNEIYSFLHGPASPLQYIHYKLSRVPLLEGEGEFGPGCFIKGTAINVVQNNLCRLALLAGVEFERANNNNTAASVYSKDAKKIKSNMLEYLVADDNSWIWCINPLTLKPDYSILNDSINRGAGLINGVSCMSSDVLGLTPLETDDEFKDYNQNTFTKLYNTPLRKEQFDKYGIWPQFDVFRAGLSSGPSYGDGYALQTMLLYDKMEMADKSVAWIANSTYQPIKEYKILRTSPYYFYERSYSPDAVGKVALEAGCGPLNLVNVTEQLKVARLIVGVDDKDVNELRLIPRIPPSWTGYIATDWVILTKNGMARADITYLKENHKVKFEVTIKGNQKFKRIALRLPYKGGWKWYYKKNTSTFNVSSDV